MKKISKRKKLNSLEDAIRRKVFGMSYEEYKEIYDRAILCSPYYIPKSNTSEKIRLYLKTIKTIFKTWEQDINDIYKNSSSNFNTSAHHTSDYYIKKYPGLLVESNGRNQRKMV